MQKFILKLNTSNVNIKNMNRLCKNLNNVQTNILTWGDPFVNKGDVVVCITGNPGVCDFYIDFAAQLHRNLQLPICVIGHAGHDGNIYKKPHNSEKNEDVFNLGAQLKHKMDLLENHIHSSSKIHLIGHSIGAWMIVELLQENDQLRDRILSVNFLFPTLQRMAETKNGKFVNNFFRKMFWFILFLCNLLYLLPTFAFRFIIYLYLKLNSIPTCNSDALLKMINPSVIEKVLIMAFDEMDKVNKLNKGGMDKIKHLTNVIYGTTDNWAPLEYMDDLKMYKPHIQMIEAYNIEHAFVLKSSECVADMVADFTKLK